MGDGSVGCPWAEVEAHAWDLARVRTSANKGTERVNNESETCSGQKQAPNSPIQQNYTQLILHSHQTMNVSSHTP